MNILSSTISYRFAPMPGEIEFLEGEAVPRDTAIMHYAMDPDAWVLCSNVIVITGLDSAGRILIPAFAPTFFGVESLHRQLRIRNRHILQTAPSTATEESK
jgi:hypothetical protein